MNKHNNIPIHQQITEKIEVEIFSGRLKPGEQILPVRELALKERVNPNTVQRALNELEKLGLIFTKRTAGKFVTEDIELIMQSRDKYAENLTKTYERKMHAIGAEIKIPKILWMEKEVKHDTIRMPKPFKKLW